MCGSKWWNAIPRFPRATKVIFFLGIHAFILFVMSLICLFLLGGKTLVPQECVVLQLSVIFYLDERLLHNTINHVAQAKTDTWGYNRTPLKATHLCFYFPPFCRLAKSISCVNCDNHKWVFAILSYKMKRCIHYQARAYGSAMPRYVTTICQVFNMKPAARKKGGRERNAFFCLP